jgi:hypothetical protein
MGAVFPLRELPRSCVPKGAAPFLPPRVTRSLYVRRALTARLETGVVARELHPRRSRSRIPSAPRLLLRLPMLSSAASSALEPVLVHPLKKCLVQGHASVRAEH